MKEKNIKLPCYGIKVNLIDEEIHSLTPNRWGGGAITSDMKETCPYCNDPNCGMDCPDFAEHCSDRNADEQIRKYEERVRFLAYRVATNALGSIILAHAMAGIDIESPAYIEGIETANDALINVDLVG